ncbi:MAG TPA: cobalamin-independent methionine synthase II family protein [Chloroflexota bacterium]|nr:cobalamin-independent methionine synthase II family protein [Chloroflexota bacterium]
MIRSDSRIRVTHQGTLPRPEPLSALVRGRASGETVDAAALDQQVRAAVADVVDRQRQIGVDSINDGEMSKSSFSDYVAQRLGGIEKTSEPYFSPITGRDKRDFPEYFASRQLGGGYRRVFQCTGPLTYDGTQAVQTDIANLQAAIAGKDVEQAYLPAVAPGSIEHWLKNSYYKSDEEFLFAIAEAMRHEYQAIIEAGFVLQIDDPDLADGWQVHPTFTLREARAEAQLRTEALNHALRGLPEDRIIMHMCWGSGKGPHTHDLPLSEFVDIVLSVHAGGYSIEAANPRHDWEWQVWEQVKLPAGKVLIPGVIAHCTDHVEHPQLVAQRLVRYANLVGRENVIAGTDCGIGSRVATGEIAWAKLAASVEGARIATQVLWG